MDGVGAGAIEAATLHLSADIKSLITWKEGQPVPYALLANKFEEISGG